LLPLLLLQPFKTYSAGPDKVQSASPLALQDRTALQRKTRFNPLGKFKRRPSMNNKTSRQDASDSDSNANELSSVPYSDWSEEENEAYLARQALLAVSPIQDLCVCQRREHWAPPVDSSLALRTATLVTQADSHAHSSEHMIKSGILDTILETDPDVLVLNEYHWYDSKAQEEDLRFQLRAQGYTMHVASGFAPIAIVSRLACIELQEIALDYERSAVIVKLDVDRHGETAWVCALNLCPYDKEARAAETAIVTDWLNQHCHANDAILVCGELYRPPDGTCDTQKKTNSSVQQETCSCARDAQVDSIFMQSQFKTVVDEGAATACNLVHPFSRNMVLHGSYQHEVSWSEYCMSVSDWQI
jgi:hypothetical protein